MLEVVNIKPVGKLCNLDCDYCYYKDVQTGPYFRVISFEILERIIKNTLAVCEGKISYVWHGGEPLLAGIDFYNQALEFMRRYSGHSKTVSNFIQTNGTLIDEQWANFFARYGFCVGVSIDGPPEVHNVFRHGKTNQETGLAVIRGIRHLQMVGIAVHALVVITSVNKDSLRDIYDWLVEQGVVSISMDPCCVSEYLLSHSDYADCMIDLYDYWSSLQGRKVPIVFLEEVVSALNGSKPKMCWLRENSCDGMVCFEADGSIVPGCDFLFSTPYAHLFSLRHRFDGKKDLSAVLQDPLYRFYLERNADVCKKCRWNYICHGGCPRYRFIFPTKNLERDYYCPAYQRIFEHILNTSSFSLNTDRL